jgi:hypothetical protein
MACPSYNCDELSDHLLNDCEVALQGGSDQIIVLDCGHTITDASNATQINDNITSGKAKLIQNIRVGLDAGSAVEVDSLIACRPQVTVNYDRTMSLIDGNVNSTNVGFYDQVFNGRAIGGLIVHLCAADKVLFIDENIKASGSLIVPNNDSEFIRFEGTFKWKSIANPQITDVPAGIFD